MRVCRPAEAGSGGWRIGLEDLATGTRMGFVTLEAFFAFCESPVVQGAGTGGSEPDAAGPES